MSNYAKLNGNFHYRLSECTHHPCYNVSKDPGNPKNLDFCSRFTEHPSFGDQKIPGRFGSDKRSLDSLPLRTLYIKNLPHIDLLLPTCTVLMMPTPRATKTTARYCHNFLFFCCPAKRSYSDPILTLPFVSNYLHYSRLPKNSKP
jgi:hypothetical protein